MLVTVNDHPLPVAAIVSRDRVLVPMRPIFEALGAVVVYRSHPARVVVRTKSHRLTVALRPPAARVIAGRTYVPLRLVAESLGARVAYDPREQIVNIFARNVRVPVTAVTHLQPAPNAQLGGGFPTISATLESHADPQKVHLTIDGNDVTSAATFDGTTITYIPLNALRQGPHIVAFYGTTRDDAPFRSEWSFNTSLGAPPDAPAAPYAMYVDGATFYPGDFMRFVLVAPPGGNAVLQLCNLGVDIPFRRIVGGNGRYEARIPVPTGYWVPACWPRAVYYDWHGAAHYILPGQPISIYTGPYAGYPAPRPSPHATPMPTPRRSVPPGPRRPPPTPTPAPAPAATPAAKPTSAAKPVHLPTNEPRVKPEGTPLP